MLDAEDMAGGRILCAGKKLTPCRSRPLEHRQLRSTAAVAVEGRKESITTGGKGGACGNLGASVLFGYEW